MVLTGTGDDGQVVFELLGAPGHLLYLISYGKVPGSHLDGLGVLGVPGDGPDRSEVPFVLLRQVCVTAFRSPR